MTHWDKQTLVDIAGRLRALNCEREAVELEVLAGTRRWVMEPKIVRTGIREFHVLMAVVGSTPCEPLPPLRR